MTPIGRSVLYVHTLVSAGQRGHPPASDSAAFLSKRLTMIATVLPVFVALIALLFMLEPLMPERQQHFIMMAVALVSVFGIGWYTDRVFDKNRDMIEIRAATIREDPNKGANWALRRMFGIWLAAFAVTGLIVVATRWALILLGVLDGPLFQT